MYCLLVTSLVLVSTVTAVEFPFTPKPLPKIIDFPIKLHKDHEEKPKEKSSLFKLPIPSLKTKFDLILESVQNKSEKLQLQDFPASTDFDELFKEIIYRGLIEYEEHNTKYPLLEWVVEQLKIPTKLFSSRKLPTAIVNINVCNACAAVFKYMVLRTRADLSQDRLVDVLVFVCKLFRISSERVCRGAIELNIDIITYIIKENKNLNELKICATVFQSFSCFKDVRSKWEVFIPNQLTQINTVKQGNGKKLRILQITDLHIDPLYEQGKSTDCGEPLCCQYDQDNHNTKDTAGKWGDYRDCDMPYHSFKNYLEQIIQQSKQPNQEIDFVYFTGDVIGHRVWNTSQQTNTEQLQKTYKMLKDFFGSTPVYPIIGNHEPHPLNVFSPPSITNEFSNRWIFDVMADEWARWLPSSTNESTRYGGYYTLVAKPGLRIIALNSNVCYTFNWWLLYDDIDPFRQLRWLSITLQEAETNNESVHILSHVPPGDKDCLQEWTRQFRKIIERYSHIVKAQFNGHTHFDELRLFYNSTNPEQIINVAYNGGSFTTFSDLNPNYRYYIVDSETYDVEDYEQWMYNLDEANSEPNKPPNWYKQYSFKEGYGLNSLKHSDLEHLVNRMASDTSLLEKYYRFKVREAAPSLLTGCKSSCNKENLCSIVTTEVDEDSKCKALTKRRGLLPFL